MATLAVWLGVVIPCFLFMRPPEFQTFQSVLVGLSVSTAPYPRATQLNVYAVQLDKSVDNIDKLLADSPVYFAISGTRGFFEGKSLSPKK